jgi:hypothetical protein
MASAAARAIADVRTRHCPAPIYRPPTAALAYIRCTKCGGLLTYTASAVEDPAIVAMSSHGHHYRVLSVRKPAGGVMDVAMRGS